MEPMPLQERAEYPGVTPLRVPYTAFISVIWVGVALTTLVLACRFFSRLRGPGRIFWDDILFIFAWLLGLLVAVLWQWAAKDMYHVIGVQAGLEQPGPDFFERLHRWLMVSLIVELFFYTALIAIKLSFLFFFRRLGDGIHYFRYIWWPVLIITVGAYLGSVGNVNYKCLVGSTEEILGVCTTLKEIKWTTTTLQANCALDVLTDFLIMVLPTILLWNTRVPRSKKLAIIALFSLTVVTMVVAIVRTVMLTATKRPDGNFDVSWLWLWSAVEPFVAILVCGFSAFPQLFTQSARNKKPVFIPSESRLRMMSRMRLKKNSKPDPWGMVSGASQMPEGGASSVERDPESGVHSDDIGLVPHGPKPFAVAWRANAPSKVAVPPHQITQEVTFSMTERKA